MYLDPRRWAQRCTDATHAVDHIARARVGSGVNEDGDAGCVRPFMFAHARFPAPSRLAALA